MTDVFERVVLPVADPEDAAATCRALSAYDVGSVLALHVIEKAGGAADKASVEQREEYAEEIFDVVRDRLDGETTLETETVFGTDVAEAIFEATGDYGATAIVITPRGGSRWIRLLTGDVALSLVTESDRPVVVLPDADGFEPSSAADGGGGDETPTAADDGSDGDEAPPGSDDGGTDGE